MFGYDMTDIELVKAFMEVCRRAGASGSGMVIDVTAGSYWDRSQYLKSVLLARLAGLQPPFKVGDKLTLNDGVSGATSTQYWGRRVTRDDLLIVKTIWFVGTKDMPKWSVEFEAIKSDRGIPLYTLNQFKLAEASEVKE